MRVSGRVSIFIEEILEPTERGSRVRVRYATNVLVAEIAATEAEVRWFGSEPVSVEISVARVVSARINDDNVAHGLSAHSDGARFVGRVENVMPLEGGGALYYLRMSTGLPSLTVDEEPFTGLVVDVGTEVELIVAGLCFCPTRI